MKNSLYIILLSSVLLSFVSCHDDDEKTSWKTENENAYNAKASDTSYVAVTLPAYSKPPIYCKVLKKGTGTIHPYETSKVKFLYKGSLIDSTVVFTGTSETDVPIEEYVNDLYISSSISFPVGVEIALQNMVAGDKWEIWIPQELAYGSSSVSTAIPAYSTLVFEIELVSITDL